MAYETWVWVEQLPDGSEGAIATMIPALGNAISILQGRRWETALAMEPLARAHGAASGNPVRVVHLVEVE